MFIILVCFKRGKKTTRKRSKQVISWGPRILMVPCLSESFLLTYKLLFFPTLLGGLLIVLQPFDIIFFFKAKTNNKERGHMGEEHAIYSAVATGISPGVPNAQCDVCHRGGRPGDNKARHPHRAHETVSRHPYRAFFISPGFFAS